MITIKFATIEDTDVIMNFINDNWKENHILARDKDFFLYEHQDNKRINYVISYDGDKINGVLGFIKYSEDNSDVATVIWKALKSDTNPMLGIELLEFLRSSSEYKVAFSPGINAKTIGIYNYLDIYTNYLSQFVIINDVIKNYKILKIKDTTYSKKLNFIENTKYSFKKIGQHQLDFNFNDSHYVPHKDKEYFVKRYYNHPIYKYTVFGVYYEESITSVIVTREVVVENSKILRIMDYLGNDNDMIYISKYLYQIVIDNDYEYIDFMCYGFNDDSLKEACFTKINLESNDLIVPNYFSPFSQENIKINFMADTKEIDKIRIFKADGDQDRPS